MSDMEVREISQPSVDQSEVKELETLVAEYVSEKKTKKPGKREIVFEGPSEAQQKKDHADEKASPLVDAAGRPRYIATRECWCHPSASDECRFHSKSEQGWETCPNQNSHSEPRKLWATNPDFGKPRDLEEVLAEAEQVVEEQTA